MIAQIISASSILEQLQLVHGDLHSANVLYKNVDNNDVIESKLGDTTYNIKKFEKLWVQWDFGI